MPKQQFVESRRGFLGGLNISSPTDMLDDDELLQCVNARIDTFGGIMRRPGSVKLFDTALAASASGGVPTSIFGVFQWNTTRQVVIVADNGALYHAVSPYTTWTMMEGNDFSPAHAEFAPFRDASAGAPLVLFICCGGAVFKFTGSALTDITAVNGVPSATSVQAFGTRLFMNSISEAKTLFWSKIGVGDDFGTGGISDGGSAIADVLTGDAIMCLQVVGSSLLIATNESIARFTGTADDIQLQQGTQGVSSEIGVNHENQTAGLAWVRAEQMSFLHSDRGAYVVTEGGVLSIDDKIRHPQQVSLRMTVNGVFAALSGTHNPIVGHNRRRSEIWYAYVPIGGSARTHCLIYNHRLQCWYGPFIYPFGITSFGVFEGDDGIEQIMAGCNDGFVRLLDDVTNSDSFDDGETDFTCTAQFAPFGLKDGPRTTKTLDHVFLQVIGDHTFDVTATGDLGLTDSGAFVS